MSDYVWGGKETQFFTSLTPDHILDAISRLGPAPTGRCLALNSMENRVYEIEVESPHNPHEMDYLVAKFYRPGRWNEAQIRQEHQFMRDLKEDEVPVVAPKSFGGETLFKDSETGLWYTLFPRKGGRAPDELNDEQVEVLGRMVARLHNTGSRSDAPDRIRIGPKSFGTKNLQFLLQSKVIPPHLESGYRNRVEKLVKLITPLFETCKTLRIHGDCHWGNIIHRPDEGPTFIDFDDMCVGPAVQDVWLCVPGVDQESKIQRELFLEAYQSMRDFDRRELKLIEPLRALRYIHFSAWIAKRWDDPAFKRAFPQFDQTNYWEIQCSDLDNQIRIIEQDQAPTY